MVTSLVFWSLSLSYTKVIESCVVDLSDLDAMKALSDEVFAGGGGGGKRHFLMNNAGIQFGAGALTDMSIVEKVMDDSMVLPSKKGLKWRLPSKNDIRENERHNITMMEEI